MLWSLVLSYPELGKTKAFFIGKGDIIHFEIALFSQREIKRNLYSFSVENHLKEFIKKPGISACSHKFKTQFNKMKNENGGKLVYLQQKNK